MGSFFFFLEMGSLMTSSSGPIQISKFPEPCIGPGGDNVLRPDIADLSDHCPVISLQTLEVRLCQWPSLTGMEHCAPHTRAVHMAMCFEREVA